MSKAQNSLNDFYPVAIMTGIGKALFREEKGNIIFDLGTHFPLSQSQQNDIIGTFKKRKLLTFAAQKGTIGISKKQLKHDYEHYLKILEAKNPAEQNAPAPEEFNATLYLSYLFMSAFLTFPKSGGATYVVFKLPNQTATQAKRIATIFKHKRLTFFYAKSTDTVEIMQDKLESFHHLFVAPAVRDYTASPSKTADIPPTLKKSPSRKSLLSLALQDQDITAAVNETNAIKGILLDCRDLEFGPHESIDWPHYFEKQDDADLYQKTLKKMYHLESRVEHVQNFGYFLRFPLESIKREDPMQHIAECLQDIKKFIKPVYPMSNVPNDKVSCQLSNPTETPLIEPKRESPPL